MIKIKDRLLILFLVLALLSTNILVARADDFSNIEKTNEYAGKSLANDKNLIVLQIDSLQNFLINKEYLDQEITPNLNKLVNESIYFDNYFEMVGKGDSGDAEFVSNNSLYPNRDKISYEAYGDYNFLGLPHYMKSLGYKTYLVTGNRAERFSRLNSYKNQGFDEFLSQEDFSSSDIINYNISDRAFFSQLSRRLEDLKDEKFYMYVTNSSSQKPYSLPKEERLLKIDDNLKDSVLEDYLETIHYVDRQIGKFIDELKDLGLYEESVLIVQGASHGISSELPETKKLMDRFLNKNYNYRDMLNVPLIVRIPGQTSRKVTTLGSHLDFFPTVANIMSDDEIVGPIFGKDLLSYKGYRPVSLDRYLPKSFMDKNMIFKMSNDGYFDHGKAMDFENGRTIDINLLRDEYDSLNKEVKKSNYILENNLVLKLAQGEKIEELPSLDKLINIDGIDRKNFDIVYGEGHRYFRFRLENYPKLKSILDNYRDIYYQIVIDDKNLANIGYLNPNLDDKVQIELSSSEYYPLIRNLGFSKLALNGDIEKDDISLGYSSLVLNKKELNSDKYELIKDHYRIMLDSKEAAITSKLNKKKIDTSIEDYRQVLNTLVSRKFENKHIVAHAGGEIEGETYTNSLDAVEKSFKEGVRLVEIDFEWTTDDCLVATHSWDGFIGKFFQVPVKRYSYDEFVNFKMINDWTQLTPNLLESWFNENPQVYLVTDIKDRNIEALKMLRDQNPFLTDKLIPQVYNFEEYIEAEKLGFKNIILTLYKIEAHNDEIVKFAKEKRPFAVTMSRNRSKTGLPARLKDIGIYTYAHTINDLAEVHALEDLGIMGIYTDRIRP